MGNLHDHSDSTRKGCISDQMYLPFQKGGENSMLKNYERVAKAFHNKSGGYLTFHPTDEDLTDEEMTELTKSMEKLLVVAEEILKDDSKWKE